MCGGTEFVQVLHTPLCPRGALHSRTLLASPSENSVTRRVCWELCCQVRERDTALGSGIQGNNRAISFLGCVLVLSVLHSCSCSTPETHPWLTTLGLCLDTPIAIHGHTYNQLSRLRINEILIRGIIPEEGQLQKKKKINENKTVQTFGLCPFLFPLFIYNCSNDYSWRDRISCISPFFGNSGPKYILGCTLKTKGVNVLNEFHMQCRYYMDDI